MKKHHTLIFSKNIPNQNIIDRLIANMLKSIKIILLMDYKDGSMFICLLINLSLRGGQSRFDYINFSIKETPRAVVQLVRNITFTIRAKSVDVG